MSVQSTCRARSSSAVTLVLPPVSSSSQITNRSFTYAAPHLWNQLPSSFRQPHCVHSFTLLLVHLILHISPHHSHHLCSHHLSLPRPFTPDLKFLLLYCFEKIRGTERTDRQTTLNAVPSLGGLHNYTVFSRRLNVRSIFQCR